MKKILILFLVSGLCMSVAWAEDAIACYSSIEEWYIDAKTLGGEQRAYVKVLKRDKNTMQLHIEKFITPFAEDLIETVDAKLQSGKYVFTFTDGWDNQASGYVKFDGNDKVELSIEITKPAKIGNNVARLYGTVQLTKCVGEEYMTSDFWTRATVQKIQAGLKSGDLKLTAHTANGETVFMLAAAFCPRPEVIRELIKAGAYVNGRSSKVYQATALMLAAENNGNSAILNELIKAGADVNARDRDRQTALMYAVRTVSIEKINLLLKVGAKINDRASYGKTVLMLALNKSDPAVLATLIKAGEKIDAVDEEGQTVLMYYLKNEYIDISILTMLIQTGANINAKNDNWLTALMIAAQNSKQTEVIETLLKAGADPNAKDDKGYTAWDYIQRNKDLLNSGAYTALDKARKK